MTTTQEFKDLFSRQSNDYARFRPSYPAKLFQYLASLVDGHDLAWDCGTGSGQAAVQLGDYFERVIATDPSAKQISSAQRYPKVEYRVGSAENSAFLDKSIDLITAAQCFHWFRQNEFFSEVRRILKPGGVLAFWCYDLCKITPEVDAIVLKLYRNVLGPYWESERKLVEAGYKNVHVPLQEITPPVFEMTADWNLEYLVGYLGTWSALQTYIQKNRSNPLEAIFPEIRAAWGETRTRSVRWEVALRVGRSHR